MSYHWSIHQLTEYLLLVSRPQDPEAALRVALERAIEALDAELGAVVVDGEVRASVGFGLREVPARFAAANQGEGHERVEIPGVGPCHALRADLTRPGDPESHTAGWLVIGRLDEPYSAEEDQMVRGMAIVLGLVLHNLRTLQAERARHQLFETLLEIQRAISAGRPLGELLEAITAGASSLLGGCPIALLLLDPIARDRFIPASARAGPELDEQSLDAAIRLIGAGAGAEVPPDGPALQSMIVERVVVGGETAGCLVARSDGRFPLRREHEEMLTAFAQQVSFALTDARALDAIHEAHHDPMTLLPNRRLFLDRLQRSMQAALAGGRELAVLFIDLDDFKAVNDTYGHRVGDELLAEVAHRISGCIRAEDTAGRLGGDEFSVLIDRGDLAAGRKLALRITECLAVPLTACGFELSITASVGVAALASSHQDAAALLSDADAAMYRAKRSGGGRWTAFEPGTAAASAA